jgi:hypothetical protein
MAFCHHDVIERTDTDPRSARVEKWVCRGCQIEFLPLLPPGWYRRWREVRKFRKELRDASP